MSSIVETTCEQYHLDISGPKSPRRVFVSRSTTTERPVTYVIDHMRFFADDRVTSLMSFDDAERTVHGRHDTRLCFRQRVSPIRTSGLVRFSTKTDPNCLQLCAL
jgi:hypothetical protein